MNHKMFEDLSKRLHFLRKVHVEKTKKEIVFGRSCTLQDVEADEANFCPCDQDSPKQEVCHVGSNGLAWCKEASPELSC